MLTLCILMLLSWVFSICFIALAYYIGFRAGRQAEQKLVELARRFKKKKEIDPDAPYRL